MLLVNNFWLYDEKNVLAFSTRQPSCAALAEKLEVRLASVVSEMTVRKSYTVFHPCQYLPRTSESTCGLAPWGAVVYNPISFPWPNVARGDRIKSSFCCVSLLCCI